MTNIKDFKSGDIIKFNILYFVILISRIKKNKWNVLSINNLHKTTVINTYIFKDVDNVTGAKISKYYLINAIFLSKKR